MKTLERSKSPTSRRSSATRPGNSRLTTVKQRRRQQDILEVRLRRGPAVRQRAQRIMIWLSVLAIIAALGVGIYLSLTKGATYLFYENPDYKIATLRVETDGVLSRDVVLETADIREGMNIFHVNLDRAKTRLEALPQVQKVRLQRQLPSTILIQIDERKPVAWIASDSGNSVSSRESVFTSPRSYLIDANAVLLKPKKVLSQQYNLPIIRGYSADHLAPGQKTDAEEVRAALDLIHAHQVSLIGARFQMLEIDVSRGYGLIVTDRIGSKVLFGLDDPELQLKALEALLPMIDTTGNKPATINLMTMGERQRNIPVTYQQELPPEPDPAAQAKPSPTPTPTPSSARKSASEKKSHSASARKETKSKHSTSSSREHTNAQQREPAHHVEPKPEPKPEVKPQPPAPPRALPADPFLPPTAGR